MKKLLDYCKRELFNVLFYLFTIFACGRLSMKLIQGGQLDTGDKFIILVSIGLTLISVTEGMITEETKYQIQQKRL